MKLVIIICAFLCFAISFNWGYQEGKDIKITSLEWSPRLPWLEYLKEQGRENERITTIYIKSGCLYVGTDSGFLVPNIIE